MNEIIIDLSDWQGKLTAANVRTMRERNVKGAWVKLTQGAGHVQKYAEWNLDVLLSGGIDIGGYHFVNNDNAIKQYENFERQLNKWRTLWMLPPFLDCEAFTNASSGYPRQAYALDLAGKPTEYSLRELMTVPGLSQSIGASMTGYGLLGMSPMTAPLLTPTGQEGDYIAEVLNIYALTLPSYQKIDVIGMRVTTWMSDLPYLKRYKFPAIYTNAGYGNTIFPMKAKVMNRYPLIVAHWDAERPLLPAIWKGKDYLSWQYTVLSAAEAVNYGILGAGLDMHKYGKLFPYPQDQDPEPPPPPPDPEPCEDHPSTINVTLKIQDGQVNDVQTWTGTLTEMGSKS